MDRGGHMLALFGANPTPLMATSTQGLEEPHQTLMQGEALLGAE